MSHLLARLSTSAVADIDKTDAVLAQPIGASSRPARPVGRGGPLRPTGPAQRGQASLIGAGAFPDRIAAAAPFHGSRLAATDEDDSPHLLAGRVRPRRDRSPGHRARPVGPGHLRRGSETVGSSHDPRDGDPRFLHSTGSRVTPAPTLLLIHGAWHGPWVWDRLRAEVPDVETVTVALPSAGDPSCDLGDDVAAVRAAVEQVQGPIVVLAHSLAGQVASEALDADSAVERIILLAALIPEIGETMPTEQGTVVYPPFWHVADGSVTIIGAREILYHDVPEPQAAEAVSRLVPQSLAAILSVTTRAAWRSIPTTYVVCEDDRALPAAFQDVVAQRARRVRRLPGGHSPMLARPAALAALVRAELADVLDSAGSVQP